MLRNIILKGGGRELRLPVTPEKIEVGTARRVETVRLLESGEVNLPAGRAVGSVSISSFFPQQDYHFAAGGEPYERIGLLERWCKREQKLRFIVSGTSINRKMLIESIHYGERDGTNDVYFDLKLVDVPPIEKATAVGIPRPVNDPPVVKERQYRAVYGDTLCGICRQYYGDGSYPLASKLAAYNGRPNPNILYVGEVLRIPPKSALGG